jgi:hypothetical protein
LESRALYGNQRGDQNIAIGYQARLYSAQCMQKATYIAGISGTAMTSADVGWNSSRRLRVLQFSVRIKRDIQPERAQSRAVLGRCACR